MKQLINFLQNLKNKNNMENDYKNLLEKEISKSPIDIKSKKLWNFFLELGTADECEAIYEAVNEEGDNLILLTTHLKNKLFDMKKNNADAWDRAIEGNNEFANLVVNY